MFGTHPQLGLRRAHSVVLLSVFALLAFAFVPGFAQADAPGIEYSPATPTATGLTPAHPQSTAHSSTANGGASAHTGGGQDNASGSEAGSNGNPSANTGKDASTGSGGDKPQGSQGNDKSGKPSDVNKAAQPSGSSSSDSGGSSPLVPILIAIAVLAAISVGVVMWRRRQGSGSQVSPKAS